jgi:hypothetical protein
MEFHLPIAEKLLEARGRVIRKELPARVAVVFDSLAPDTLGAITAYVGESVSV